VKRRSLRTRLEQLRQAKAIHGGVVGLCVAALGVKLSRMPIPTRRLRLLVYRAVYGGKYTTLDESECERPLWAYRSLNALFTRGLRPECRPIPAPAEQFLCPCDGRVQEVGRLRSDRLLTVKGIEYTAAALLPGIDPQPFHDGHYGIFFLSPADCHRIFSPQDVRIEEVLHVPGYRLLVHPPYQRQEYPVFALNERVILRMATPLGACVMVLVAGWGVGNIRLRFDRTFRPRARAITRRAYPEPVQLRRGDWMATFELGSTAILITEANDRLRAVLTQDEKVKYGQPAFAAAG
jgi:phosphatidylserine decarboxylase